MPVLIREIAESAQNDLWLGNRGADDLSRRSA
jgi:hypothetical protein